MVKVCVGWLAPHESRILEPEDGTGIGTSHGMCPECSEKVDRDLRLREERKAAEQSGLDPRD